MKQISVIELVSDLQGDGNPFHTLKWWDIGVNRVL